MQGGPGVTHIDVSTQALGEGTHIGPHLWSTNPKALSSADVVIGPDVETRSCGQTRTGIVMLKAPNSYVVAPCCQGACYLHNVCIFCDTAAV